MKKILSLAIMALVIVACAGNDNETGCWSSGEYKLYNIFPSKYFLNIDGNNVIQSVYLEDANNADNNMYTVWEGVITERTESERGLEILVEYNKVQHYRKDTVIEPKNLSPDEQTAQYRIVNDTLSSTRMPVKFTKCHKGDIPTVEDFLAGKLNRQ